MFKYDFPQISEVGLPLTEGTAIGNEKCCATRCIPADSACCDNSPTGGWCEGSQYVCQPCPAGQTCYARNIDTGGSVVVSFACCKNNVCTFDLSSSTLVTSISAPNSPSPVSSETTV